MAVTITTRAAKGSKLTTVEVDANFSNLKISADSSADGLTAVEAAVVAVEAAVAAISSPVDPTDIGFDVILLAGQSNMRGGAPIDAVQDVLSDRVWQWGAKSSDSAKYQKILPASDPLSFPDTNTGLNGPSIWLGRTYAATIPANRMVLLVPMAVGSSTLSSGNGDWSAGGPMYTPAVTQANAALVAAKLLYPNSRFVGIAYVQGEQEAQNTANTPAAYKTAWTNMAAGFRAAITGASSAWIVIGSMLPEYISSASNGPAIDLAHQQLATDVQHCAYVSGPTGYSLDGVHYNAAGSRILGARLGSAIRGAVLNANYGGVIEATGITMTGPASGVSGVASTNFNLGVTPTNGTLVGVTVTPSDAGAGGTFTPTSRGLTTAAPTATFTYTPSSAGAKTISVTNNGSLTNPSNITYTASAAATAPGAPTSVTATAGNASASVAFTAPVSNGGSAITGYTVTSSPGGFTGTGAASPITVNGLTNGTAYTFTVTATNAIGTSSASSASSAVTPSAGATAPEQVTGLTLGTATSTTQPLTWTAPSNGGSAITDYVVQWSPAGAGTWTTFADGTSTTASAAVTGLAASTSYDYRVAAVNAIGTGTNSSTATGSTAAAGATYTTLNPADKDASINLSNGNLTYTRGTKTSEWPSVRGISGKTSGKWYFEVKIDNPSVFVGLGIASTPIGSFPGSDAGGTSIGVWADGSIYKGNTTIARVSASGSVPTGAYIGVALNLDASPRTVTLMQNNTVHNGVDINLSTMTGAIYPMMGANNTGSAGTCNFGDTTFAYTPPAGYSGWTA